MIREAVGGTAVLRCFKNIHFKICFKKKITSTFWWGRFQNCCLPEVLPLDLQLENFGVTTQIWEVKYPVDTGRKLNVLRLLEDVQDVFRTSYVRSVYVIVYGVSYWILLTFPSEISNIILPLLLLSLQKVLQTNESFPSFFWINCTAMH